MKQALVLFSGGKDSFLATLLMIEQGYKVNLVTFDNGCGLEVDNALHGANRIQEKYGKDKVSIIGIKRVDAVWREFLRLYYNLTPSDILNNFGEVTVSQFNCLSCRVAMYASAIIIALQSNIDVVVDGARKSQLFAIEQPELLGQFEQLFKSFNLSILYPCVSINDDFTLKNELLIRGFVPKTLESQCLLGMPLDSISEETIKGTSKVYENLIKDKAHQLIKKYQNIDIARKCI